MADFKIAFERRKPIEGGYSDAPEDAGNWTGGEQGRGLLAGTNWGITVCEYSRFLGRMANKADMQNMPIEHAESIFRNRYWNIMRGDEIIDQELANDLYDACVNQGVRTGIKQIQSAANIAATGMMDDKTLNNLNNK